MKKMLPAILTLLAILGLGLWRFTSPGLAQFCPAATPRTCDINRDPTAADVWEQNYDGRNFESFRWDGLGMEREKQTAFHFDWQEPWNPHCVGGADYSVRFTGSLTAPQGTGTYGLAFYVNDGVRIWIDKNRDGTLDASEKILDDWGNLGWKWLEAPASVSLAQGQWYQFKIEYNQEKGNDGFLDFFYRAPPGYWDPERGSTPERTLWPKSAFKTCSPPAPTPTPPPGPTPTPPATNYDCAAPETGPLTQIPAEGPFVELVFKGVGNFVDAPPEAACESGKGEWVSVTWQAKFTIEDLESIFAKYNADYFEGDFQDPNPLSFHRQTNLLNLASSQWNDYNGPAQKLSPAILFDQEVGELSGLKIKYINYILNPEKANRLDVQFTYTDIYGNGPPQTLKQLVGKYGFPNPPTASSSEAEKAAWQNTWGRYWPKIPLAANDKAWGNIKVAAFPLDEWGNPIAAVCPLPEVYQIVVPEYFRTNLVSAHLNRLLLPKIAQSPLSFQPEENSLAQSFSSSSCNFPVKNPPPLSIKSNPPPLLASVQTNFSPKTSPQTEGAVLAELIDIDHGACQNRPPADPGRADKYCMQDKIPNMPDKIPVPAKPRTDQAFVCAQAIKNCPAPPSGPCTLGDYWTSCVEGCDYGGVEEVFQCNGTSWDYKYPQQNSACCGYTCPVTYIPGQKTVRIPISVILGVPYLESIWNKSTSYQDNQKSGFLGFFSPSVETGVLLNQAQYEKHGETPDPDNYQGEISVLRIGAGSAEARFVPPDQGKAYPDFVAGVKNATNWIRNTLWPTMGDQTICLTNQPCANNPAQTWNTYCTPNCADPNRRCYDDPSCEIPPPDCNALGGDAYCASIPGGRCGPNYTCSVKSKCEEGGNCVTECSCP